MMMKDYLKDLSLTDFFILIRLECDEPFGEGKSLSQLDAGDRDTIKQDSVSTEAKSCEARRSSPSPRWATEAGIGGRVIIGDTMYLLLP